MRYKVGDKVRIRKDLDRNKRYNICSVLYEMVKYAGKEATIAEVYSSHYKLDIDDKYWGWTDEMLESEDRMTILDLINKSVTGEEMPEKVEYHEKEYEYDKEINDYRYINCDEDYLFDKTQHFLDEVEIIDDRTDKKAEAMASLEKLVDDLMGYGE